MYIQLLIFILALIGLNIYKESGTPLQQQKNRKKYITFMMVLLALQSGLRNVAVGADTYAYYLMFDKATHYSLYQLLFDNTALSFKDPGYLILTKLFSVFIPNYRLFLIAIAIFFFSALGKLLYRYLNSNLDVLVSIALYECLYYSFFSITGLRQTIATGILLFALPLVLDKRHKRKNTILFFLLLFVASTIHKSAFLFLPVYFLPRFRNNKQVFLSVFVLFVPMFYAGGGLGSILEDTEFERYTHYFEQNETVGAVVFTVYIVMLTLAVFFKLKKINSYSKDNHVFSSSIAIAMMLSPLLVLDPNNQRIVQYYSIFGLIILPQICYAYSGTLSKKGLYIPVFAILAAYTILRYEPYAFFWQDMLFGEGSQIINDSMLN